MTTDNKLQRRAIDPNGLLGSFYDATRDQLHHPSNIQLRAQLNKTKERAQCVVKPLYSDLPNPLKVMGMDDELRLSIVLQMIPAEGVAALIHYTGPVSQRTRIMSYTFIDRTELVSNEDLQELSEREKNNDDDTISILGTHLVVMIKYGIDAHLILELPSNEQDATKIETILQRLSVGLRSDAPPHLSSEDERLLKKIQRTEIFSNIPSLTGVKSILDFLRQIPQLKKDTTLHRPCEYQLCPVSHLCSLENSLNWRYRPIDGSTLHQIEDYVLKWSKDLKTLKEELVEQRGEIDRLYHEELDRLRTWVFNERKFISDGKSIEALLKEAKSKTFRSRLERFLLDARNQRSFKEYYKNNAVPTEFRFDNAAAYDLQSKDDDQILREKLIGKQEHVRVLCGSYSLYNQNLSIWNRWCDECLEDQKRNPKLQLIYVDFTDHPYPLNSLKVFNSEARDAGRSSRVLPTQLSVTSDPNDNEIFNILLLGESGVGKSTFVNALVNYLRFDSYAQAKAQMPTVILPVSFTVTTGDDFQEHAITSDGIDANSSENHNQVGGSITRLCRSYRMNIVDDQKIQRKIRLIDTPGMTDTRGLKHDSEHLREILEYINNLSHLHAICIILRPNITRLSVSFRCALEQIFHLLGDKTRDNILFCFTNTRPTFYSPGNTGPVLRSFLELLSVNRVPFGKANTFCFENEPFRYLVAKEKGIEIDADDVDAMDDSWKQSYKETKRLLQRIITQMNKYEIHTFSRTSNMARLEIAVLIQPMIEAMVELEQQKTTTEAPSSLFNELFNISIMFRSFLLSDHLSSGNDPFLLELDRLIENDQTTTSKEILQQLKTKYINSLATTPVDPSRINELIDTLYTYPIIRTKIDVIQSDRKKIFKTREFQIPLNGLHFD